MTQSPTSADATSSGRYHHGDLRTALIDASVELVSTAGADGFTLKDASRIAGVSVAAPYRHFADKSELLHEVTEVAFHKMGSLMRKNAGGQELGTIESITEMGKTYVRFANENQQLFRLMCENHKGGPDINLEEIFKEHASGQNEKSLIDLLEIKNHDINNYALAKNAPNKGIACFSIPLKSVAMFLDRNNIDVQHTLKIATPMWTIVHGTAFLLIDHKFQNLTPSIDTDDIVERATRYFLKGLLLEYKETGQI